jgi:hypothetical protein
MKIGSSGKRVRLWDLVWSSAIANQQSEHMRVFRSGARGTVENRMYSSIPQETHLSGLFQEQWGRVSLCISDCMAEGEGFYARTLSHSVKNQSFTRFSLAFMRL